MQILKYFKSVSMFLKCKNNETDKCCTFIIFEVYYAINAWHFNSQCKNLNNNGFFNNRDAFIIYCMIFVPAIESKK